MTKKTETTVPDPPAAAQPHDGFLQWTCRDYSRRPKTKRGTYEWIIWIEDDGIVADVYDEPQNMDMQGG